MEPFLQKEESFYSIQDWEEKHPGLIAGFSTRHGGVSTGAYQGLNLGFHVNDDKNSVCQNRRILGSRLDFPVEQWIGAEQTHGKHIFRAGKEDRGRGALSYDSSIPNTDGLFTEDSGTLLSLCYADCVPLYFLAPRVKRVGVAHAGWKGTVQGIGAEMIERWKQDGIRPEEIEVVIGPSICGSCYTVDRRVIDEAERWVKEEKEQPFHSLKGQPGQFLLDLKALNAIIIEQAGIPAGQIRQSGLCTSCNEKFYSHRRDKGITGRMISFIGWKENVSL